MLTTLHKAAAVAESLADCTALLEVPVETHIGVKTVAIFTPSPTALVKPQLTEYTKFVSAAASALECALSSEI